MEARSQFSDSRMTGRHLWSLLIRRQDRKEDDERDDEDDDRDGEWDDEVRVMRKMWHYSRINRD